MLNSNEKEDNLPSSRKEALKLNSKYYKTGKSCKRGHSCCRYTTSKGCVLCIEELQIKYRTKNKDSIKKNRQIYYKNNKEKLLTQQTEYRNKNKDKRQQYYKNNREKFLNNRKDYYQNNKEYIKLSGKEYYIKNKTKILERDKKYRIKNRNIIIKRNIEYSKRKRKTDIQFRLRINLRRRLNHALKNNYKSGSAVRDLGCSIEDLKKRFEMLFLPGMSWNNYGEWHIDHIIPLSKFDLTDRNQLLRAINFTNLQPLWAKDNLVKSNKIQCV